MRRVSCAIRVSEYPHCSSVSRGESVFGLTRKGTIVKVSKAQRVRYFYEYMFYDAIAAHNAAHPDDLVRTSEGRQLHKRWCNTLVAEGVTRSKLGAKRAMRTMNTVLGERFGEPVFEQATIDDARWQSYIGAYDSLLGSSAADAEFEDGSLIIKDGHYLPISPYDEQFSLRSCVLDNGSRLGGIGPTSVIDEVDELSDPARARAVTYTPELERDSAGVWRSTAQDSGDSYLVSDDDIAGLSALRLHMTQAEYAASRPWVLAGNDVSDVSPETMAAREQAQTRAVAILQELSDLGRDVHIEPDGRVGQICAAVEGTSVKIRLTDTPQNARYVGKVYDNGTEVRYKSTYMAKSGNVMFEPTPTDSANLVRFALGEPVVSPDGKDVGLSATHTRLRRNKRVQTNTAYHTKSGFFANYTAATNAQGRVDERFGNVVRIAYTPRMRAATQFGTAEAAELWLRESVDSARANFEKDLGVEYLIEHADHEEEIEFSSDEGIASVQAQYLDVLRSGAMTLTRPDVSADAQDAWPTDSHAERAVYEQMQKERYIGGETPAEHVRLHASALVDVQIGTYGFDDHGTRFCPSGVARYMDSAWGGARNTDDIVAAARKLDIRPDELKSLNTYDTRVMDRLIRFNRDSAQAVSEHPSEFVRAMGRELTGALSANGARDIEVRIDDAGIMRYAGTVECAERTGDTKQIEGEIGQIFAPDARGVVKTEFASDSNYAFVPGYDAYVVRDGGSLEQRTRLIGYEQHMGRALRKQVREDVAAQTSSDAVLGAPTSLNRVYGHLSATRHDLDFVEQWQAGGMEPATIEALITTEAERVRYSNAFKNSSTLHAAYMAELGRGADLANDNSNDPYILSGGRNMSILTEASDGYFDPIVTTATTTAQGCVRYLVDGAQVRMDGTIVPSADKSDRCAIMHDDVMKYAAHDPFDRQNMTVSNLTKATGVSRAHVAQMNFGGWNMDDGMVVSKRFADATKIRARTGELRSLVVGDKLSDFHGNKGVVSLIVDPELADDLAQARQLSDEVAWFRANPELDVVMAPFSAPGRLNGGSGRELMESGVVSDLVAPDGTVYTGAMSACNLIVTDKSADAKTRAYTADDIAQGKGRRASAQLAWSLCAKGADDIMSECYGSNLRALADAREMLITCGLDIDETGHLHTGYAPHGSETRRVIELPDMIWAKDADGKRTGLDKRAMLAQFSDTISREGGLLEVPFELRYPTQDALPPLNDGKSDVIYTEAQWERKGYVRRDGVHVKPAVVHRSLATSRRQTGDITYGLPVLSSHLRSTYTMDDGESTTHELTHHYEAIYMACAQYADAKLCQAKPELYSEAAQARVEKTLQTAPRLAQARYDRICDHVISQDFEAKRNVFRNEIMARRMPMSATAIWSEDPRLAIDQIALGRELADSLALHDGDTALVVRDPILRTGGVRALSVQVADEIVGCAINPCMDKCFDGDFDGDTVGIFNLRTKAARTQAAQLFGVSTNLLDKGAAKPDLFVNTGLDVQVTRHSDADLDNVLNGLSAHVDSFEQAFVAGELDADSLASMRVDATQILSDGLRAALKQSMGTAVIRFDGPAEHIASVRSACVDTGAKGSDAKVDAYGSWVGYKPDGSATRVPGRSDQEQVMFATAVKSFGTGIAGSYSQRAIRALRDRCPDEVLELTYPVTQSLLQSKHDATEAKAKYDMLMGPVRHLWRGEALEHTDDGGWSVVRDADGRPVAARVSEWKKTFETMYTLPTAKGGLNVSVNQKNIDVVAHALDDGSGHIRNIEADVAEMASPLDELAYGGGFEQLKRLCDEKADLFDGAHTLAFAPKWVQKNRVAKAIGDAKHIHPVVLSDTIDDVISKTKVSEKQVVQNKPKHMAVPEIEVGETSEAVLSELGN